ncbi:MAG: M14 family metallopeptidase [Bryobacteraceae bacterium]|nr:M14 family metallopeptidase [Bryobacteraceae bacterium]
MLGFEPGEDYKLANYSQITSYFQKLAASTDRMRLVEYGKTSQGRTSYMAFFSSPENLRQLDRFKEINRKLALGLVPGAAEAQALAKEGKVFVWIDSGLHATEVAPAQHSPELAYRMVTEESDEMRRIRDRVILIQIPCINPDGLDMVVEWYRKNVGTPYELAPLPGLYQKYAGHDNNRDWYMMNLQETRNVSRLLFEEWFPQIVYNQHQSPAFPARIFVPPYAEPLNPNIPAPVMEGINLIGAAMKERFARESKPGILSYFGFDAWWNGGLRSVPAFHNMHGILTETALHGYATPRVYKPADFPERFGNGMPTKQPTVFYERPWMGGKWGTREAIDYMLTADMAILDLASTRSEAFLSKAWQMARDNIEAGKKSAPYAYVIPQDQWDKSSSVEMLRRLQMGGITVHRSTSAFTVGGQKHPAGTFVLLAAQPFRGYLVDLMEPQKYPEIRSGTTGPTKRPYDVAGWTLPMQMGVKVQRSDDMFQASLEPATSLALPPPAWDFRDTGSFRTVADALAKNENVRRAEDGRFLRSSDGDYRRAKWELAAPRVGLYMSWSPNIDAGWTQFLLDEFRVGNTVLRNDDIRKGNLRARFDTIILPDQAMESILHGWREGQQVGGGANTTAAQQRPEFTGGIGLQGAAALEAFVREGGTLLAFDDASDLPVQLFGLPVRSALAGAPGGGADEAADSAAGAGYYSPGSILRIQVDTAQPVALGMPADSFAFQSGGKAWDIRLLADFNKGDRAIASVAKYASRDLLASGWLSGEKRVAGKSLLIDARHGQGRVVLFGFRPQFRGQSWATFRLVLNAVYLSSAKML